MVIIRRDGIKIDFLDIVVGGRQQTFGFMANATKSVNHIKLFDYKIQTTLFFGKKPKNICFITIKAVK